MFLEGCADALRLREYGYNAYACLGNQLGDHKLDLIRKSFRRSKEIILIPDSDNGGEHLIKWFSKLVYDFDIKIVELKDNGKSISFEGRVLKDIDEIGSVLGKKMVQRILKKAIPYSDLYIKRNFKKASAPKLVTELVSDKFSKRPTEIKKQSNRDLLINQLYWSGIRF